MTCGRLDQWPSGIRRERRDKCWARLTGREGEGATTEGGQQPSLQQEEEGGKEKERARTRQK